MSILIETNRLILRKLVKTDIEAMKEILQDQETMKYYEHAFSDNEVLEWYNRQLERSNDKYYLGLQAVVLKENNKMIGLSGLTKQQIENKTIIEVGYLFNRKYWHNGYAYEASNALIKLGFSLGINKIYSIIRDTNINSKKVAKRNNMILTGKFVKHYYNMNMLHEIHCVENDNKIRIDRS